MARFKKGVSGNPKGRPAGKSNKTVEQLRGAVQAFIEKNWNQYEWEKGDTLDTDPEEREEYCVMTCEVEGFTFEGTGTYSCGELIIVDNIEVK